jgi:hypothetical protein
MRATLLVVLLLVGLTVVPAAAAQTDTSTTTAQTETPGTDTATASPTPTEAPDGEANRSVVGSLPGDPAVTIVDYSYNPDTEIMTVSLETSEYRAVTVTATNDESTGLGTGYIVSRELTTGSIHQIEITAPSGTASISTGPSMEAGKFGTISAQSSSALLSGVPDSTDKLWAGLGAALGTAAGALAIVVRERLGIHRGMERKA